MSYDPYAAQVVSLLSFDGDDGSTQFVDQAGPIWTPAGGAHLSTAIGTPFGAGASGLFNGVDAYITSPFSANRSFERDATFEAFIYLLAFSASSSPIYSNRGTGGTHDCFIFQSDSQGHLQFVIWNSAGGVAANVSSAAGIALNAWNHVEIDRSGNTFYIFINGQLQGTAVWSGGSYAPFTRLAYGIDPTAAGRLLNGYISNGRYTDGVARHTADFAPPAAPFVLDSGPPTITTPRLVSGTLSLSGTVTISADPADDTGIASVQFELDGAPLGALLAAAPWQVIWDTTTVADGGHVVTAVVTDVAGNQTTSDPVQYNVKNDFQAPSTLPSVQITTPANGAVIIGTVPVTAAASDSGGIESVQFKVDDSLLGAAIAVAPFTVDFDTTTVPDGAHVLKAVATDTDGNTVTSSITVVVSNEQPALAPVAISVRNYREQLRAHLPPGPALDDAGEGKLTDLMDGLAAEFQRIDARGGDLLDEADPRTADEMLADWERLTGLVAGDQTDAARRNAVVAKLTSNSAPSRAFLIQQAATLGYTVTIVERHARRYRALLGDLYGGIAWQFVWEVHVADVAAAPDLEALLKSYAPAHTVVHFIYA